MKPYHEGPIVGAKPPFLERLVRGFSLKRGLAYFLVGLVVFSIMVFIRSFFADEFHMDGAIIFVVGASALASILGLFTNKVPM